MGENDLLYVVQPSYFEITWSLQNGNVIFAHLNYPNIGTWVWNLDFFATFINAEQNQLELSETEDFVSDNFEKNYTGTQFLEQCLSQNLHLYLTELIFDCRFGFQIGKPINVIILLERKKVWQVRGQSFFQNKCILLFYNVQRRLATLFIIGIIISLQKLNKI